MTLISQILITLVGLEFCYIMYLETIVPTSATTSKVFGIAPEKLADEVVKTQLKNQGVYNGLIGIALFVIAWVLASKAAALAVLTYIVLVAAYGGISVDKSIFIKQAGLAIIAILCLSLIG